MARSLSEIDADLSAAYTARREILTKGQAVAGDGASKSRASLGDINELIAELQRERAMVGGRGGVTFTPTIGGAH